MDHARNSPALEVIGKEQGIPPLPPVQGTPGKDVVVVTSASSMQMEKRRKSISSMPPSDALDTEQPEKQLSSMRAFGIAATTVLAMSLNSGSAQALNIALPTMGADLGITDDQLQWFISAYS